MNLRGYAKSKMKELKRGYGQYRDWETKLYTIYDKKSGTWDKPFAARTHGEAERMFAQVLNGGE